MTAVFQHVCPHCGTKDVAFTMLHEVRVPRPYGGRHVFATCGHCGAGIVALFCVAEGFALKDYTPGGDYVNFIHAWPDPIWGQVPDQLPDNVGRFFRQGLDGMDRNFDAAGAMFRKALDVGIKIKFPTIKGNLYERISAAVKAGGLTVELGEWAHHIRLEGNDAVHDDDPYTEKEVRDLHVFTDLVMRYLFTLPGMLAARREKTEAATAE